MLGLVLCWVLRLLRLLFCWVLRLVLCWVLRLLLGLLNRLLLVDGEIVIFVRLLDGCCGLLMRLFMVVRVWAEGAEVQVAGVNCHLGA